MNLLSYCVETAIGFLKTHPYLGPTFLFAAGLRIYYQLVVVRYLYFCICLTHEALSKDLDNKNSLMMTSFFTGECSWIAKGGQNLRFS